VISGAHGTEYASIIAAMRLIDRIDPAKLSGTVIIAPLLNRPSFERMRVHTNPTDEKGMNASYPGNPGGTQTDRALALVAREILDRADIVIDLHNGDLDEDLRPYSYWMRTGKADLDSATRRMVLAFGLNHIIVTNVDVSNPAQTRSASGYMLAKGKRTIVAEAGRSGLVPPEDLRSLVDGCLNVLVSLGMLAQPARPAPSPITWLGGGERVRADSAGVWFASARRDQLVRKGAELGYITDFLGRKTTTVTSPIDGRITFIRGVPSLWRGATIVNVAEVYSKPPSYSKPE
jgi:predicted deacylase